MILQLNPSIPLNTPKGDGLAWMVLDYGEEHHLIWVVAIDDTGEIWSFPNPQVRATKNITMERLTKERDMKRDTKGHKVKKMEKVPPNYKQPKSYKKNDTSNKKLIKK